MDKVNDSLNLVRRKLTQHRQTHVAVTRETGKSEVDNEHFLVVTDFTVHKVPGCQSAVEQRIRYQHPRVSLVNACQVPVRRRQQRVQNVQTPILLWRRSVRHE